MTVPGIISILRQHGALEESRLASAEVLLATPNRQCPPALEIVLHDTGWVTQITVADALWFEFSGVEADQQIVRSLLGDIMRHGSRVVTERGRRWFVTGNLYCAAQQHRWSGYSNERQWCAWVEGTTSDDDFQVFRIP